MVTLRLEVIRNDMNNQLIRYDLLVQDAMRGVVRKVLGKSPRWASCPENIISRSPSARRARR